MADYREIPLTHGLVAIVDADDYAMLAGRKWYVDFRRWGGYVRASASGERMHRVISGAGPGEQVDHRNHDKLDNRRENLRVCAGSQNSMNRVMRSDNTSGYKGVYLRKSTGKWVAVIGANGRKKKLGSFARLEDAAAAYRAAALNLHGEFACL